MVGISDQGNVDLAKSALLAGEVGPGKQGKLRVGGSKQDLSTTLLELGNGLRVGNDLGRADKGESEGDKAENDPLAFVLVEGEFFEKTVDNGLLLESGSRVSDSSDHC